MRDIKEACDLISRPWLETSSSGSARVPVLCPHGSQERQQWAAAPSPPLCGFQLHSICLVHFWSPARQRNARQSFLTFLGGLRKSSAVLNLILSVQLTARGDSVRGFISAVDRSLKAEGKTEKVFWSYVFFFLSGHIFLTFRMFLLLYFILLHAHLAQYVNKFPVNTTSCVLLSQPSCVPAHWGVDKKEKRIRKLNTRFYGSPVFTLKDVFIPFFALAAVYRALWSKTPRDRRHHPTALTWRALKPPSTAAWLSPFIPFWFAVTTVRLCTLTALFFSPFQWKSFQIKQRLLLKCKRQHVASAIAFHVVFLFELYVFISFIYLFILQGVFFFIHSAQ